MDVDFRIQRITWAERGEVCAALREKVFVYEMRIERHFESDGRDPVCEHVLAVGPAGEAIGTGRIDPNGKISRIAVLMPWRQSGVGSALLNELVCIARDRGLQNAALSAPLFALEFYRNHDFEPQGAVYMEAGMPHQRMSLSLGSMRNSSAYLSPGITLARAR